MLLLKLVDTFGLVKEGVEPESVDVVVVLHVWNTEHERDFDHTFLEFLGRSGVYAAIPDDATVCAPLWEVPQVWTRLNEPSPKRQLAHRGKHGTLKVNL